MAQNVTDGWENLPAYISYSIQGFLIGSGNLLIVLCILRYEALRSNKEYIIMMALSLADTINMTGFLTAGLFNIHNSFFTKPCSHSPRPFRAANFSKGRFIG